MRTLRLHGLLLTAVATFCSSATTFAQPAPAAPPAREVRRLTLEAAVRQGLEQNLGIQVARFAPQVLDLTIAQLVASWNPSLTTSIAGSSVDTPNTSLFSGAAGPKTTDHRLLSNVSLTQTLRRGGSYSIGWDNSRSTTTNIFSNFSPQVNSSLSVSIVQPLLRNFRIDSVRQQVEVAGKNRDVSNLTLQASILNTSRAVRNAYWDLSYAIAFLKVQQQSLQLAQESLRQNRARVEIGTMAPLDIVAAESEVAQREEAVIVAEAGIDRAEDVLRVLIYDASSPDFWTVRIEPGDEAPFQATPVDVDGAVRRALDRRTDLQQSRKALEATDVNIRYFENQILPEVNAVFDYGLAGLGGSQLVRGDGFPGPIVGRTNRSFGSVLGDLFGNDFPRWTLSLNVRYPLGASPQESTLARTRLQSSQAQAQLKNQQVQVAAQVRDAGRTVQMNQKRVASTRVSRGLAERRLEAEEKKFAAGQSTSFFVFQAQRDLALAQNNELRAVLDYNKALVDFETIQEAPPGGAATVATVGTAAPEVQLQF